MPLLSPSQAEEVLSDLKTLASLLELNVYRDNKIPDGDDAGFPGRQIHRHHQAGIGIPGNGRLTRSADDLHRRRDVSLPAGSLRRLG